MASNHGTEQAVDSPRAARLWPSRIPSARFSKHSPPPLPPQDLPRQPSRRPTLPCTSPPPAGTAIRMSRAVMSSEGPLRLLMAGARFRLYP